MDAVRGGWVVDHREEVLLRFESISGSVGWVDTGDDHVIVVAGVEAGLLQGRGHSVNHLGTEHTALEVDERHDGGAMPEVGAQGNVISAFVAEVIGQREWMIQVLVDARVLEIGRGELRGCSERLVGGILSECVPAESDQSERKSENSSARVHITGYAFGRVTSHPFANCAKGWGTPFLAGRCLTAGLAAQGEKRTCGAGPSASLRMTNLSGVIFLRGIPVRY